MGERVQKIAFLIFALAFVAIMAVLNTSILTLGTSANGQLTATVSSNDSALAIYDQGDVYGSTVINCAKDPSKVCSTDMRVFVVTNASAQDSAKVKEYGTVANEKYMPDGGINDINSTAKFNSYLCYNANNVCTGILFVQDGAGLDAATLKTLADGLTVAC